MQLCLGVCQSISSDNKIYGNVGYVCFSGKCYISNSYKKKCSYSAILPHKSEKKNKRYFINSLQQKAESASLTVG